MKICIIGSEGFIGQECVRMFQKEESLLVGIDQKAPKRKTYAYKKGDIRDERIAKSIPEETDAVIHLAALSRAPECEGKIKETCEMNIGGALNVYEAAKKRKARQFLFASSEWVYGESRDEEPKSEKTTIDIWKLETEYAWSKAVAERALALANKKEDGPVITILRFGIVYGPKRNIVAPEVLALQVARENYIEVGSLQTGRHFTHVQDIARGIQACIGQKNSLEIFNCCADKLSTLGEIIAFAKKITGRNPEVRERARDEYQRRPMTNEKLKKTTGWRPEVPLEKGIEEILQAEKNT